MSVAVGNKSNNVSLPPQFSNYAQGLSVLRQVVYALAVGEAALEFEHRDLHLGNILIKRTEVAELKVNLLGQEHRLPSAGVHATIIDFTISRLKKGWLD